MTKCIKRNKTTPFVACTKAILDKYKTNSKNHTTLIVYLHILSLPDDWDFYKNQVAKTLGIGTNKLSKIYTQLEKDGFIRCVQIRDEQGRFTHTEIEIYDIAQQFNFSNNKDLGACAPHHGNGDTATVTPCQPTNKNIGNKEITKKTLCASSDAPNNNFPDKEEARYLFDLWWISYPIKKNKQRAFNLWMKRKLHEKYSEIMTHTQNAIKEDAEWKRGAIPHPSTYLENKRWTDEITKVVQVIPKQNNYARVETIRPQLPDWTTERMEKETNAVSTNKPANLDGDAALKAKRFLEEARKSLGSR